MYLEVKENKVVKVNELEATRTSSYYLLSQKRQMDIQQEVYETTSVWVEEQKKLLGEENVTQEMCDEKMKENYTAKFEELGIHDVYVIMVNGKVTYLHENPEGCEDEEAFMRDGVEMYTEIKSCLEKGQTYLKLHSDYLKE